MSSISDLVSSKWFKTFNFISADLLFRVLIYCHMASGAASDKFGIVENEKCGPATGTDSNLPE